MSSFYETEMQEDEDDKNKPHNRKASKIWESISQTVGDASSGSEDDEKV
jgi:hypothetical protein